MMQKVQTASRAQHRLPKMPRQATSVLPLASLTAESETLLLSCLESGGEPLPFVPDPAAPRLTVKRLKQLHDDLLSVGFSPKHVDAVLRRPEVPSTRTLRELIADTEVAC